MNVMQATYSDIELTSEIHSASNHRVIQMLLDKCIYHLNLANKHIASNELASRNYSITKAHNILMHLRQCLNFEDLQVKELSELLDKNYHYAEKCLFNATLKNETKYVDLSLIVLNNIKSAWDEMNLNDKT